MGLYALPPALSPEEKKQQVQECLEYALDAAILEEAERSDCIRLFKAAGRRCPKHLSLRSPRAHVGTPCSAAPAWNGQSQSV